MRPVKIIVERHPDTYVAYPIGMEGVVVGQGDSFQEAIDSLAAALEFHVETFGTAVLDESSPVIEAFVAETRISA